MQLKSSFHDGILFLMTLPPLIGGAFVPKKYWVFNLMSDGRYSFHPPS
jgi:hypothetical protein